MARKRAVKPRSWFEPWTPSKSPRHGPAPKLDGLDEDAAAAILEAWERVDQNADWILWGSGMYDPCIVTNFVTGKPQVMDDQGIIAISKHRGLPDGSPSNEDICRRIAECVNAMTGVADPVEFMRNIRALLKGYSIGEQCDDPRTDPKVLRLLDQCLTTEERKACE